MKKIVVWLIVGAFGFCLSGAGRTRSLNFRMTTSLYNWERFDTDSTASKHPRLYQLGSFNLNQSIEGSYSHAQRLHSFSGSRLRFR